MPSLLDPKLEHGRAILLEAYAGEQILGVRTSRYLYTEWDGDKNPLLPERELYDMYADPNQLNNLAGDPAYAAGRQPARQRARPADRLRGRVCRGVPIGTLTLATGGNGKNGCVFPPVTAQFSSPDEAGIVSVSFRAGKTAIADDTVPPFEAPIPDSAIRSELPDKAAISAKAVFNDGRRLGYSQSVRLCK